MEDSSQGETPSANLDVRPALNPTPSYPFNGFLQEKWVSGFMGSGKRGLGFGGVRLAVLLPRSSQTPIS